MMFCFPLRFSWLRAGLLVWAALTAWSARAQEPAPTPAPAAALSDARAALAEMARLESQLDQLRQAAQRGREALASTSATLTSVEAGLRQRERLRQEGDAALSAAGEASGERARALERELAEARQQRSRARAALRVSTALLLHEADRPPRPALALALAARDRDLRQRVQLATHRILQNEQALADLQSGRTRTEASARYYSAFSRLGEDQLRARHAELAETLDRLQADLNTSQTQAGALSARRDELNQLMAQLAQKEVAAAPAPDPAAPPALAALPDNLAVLFWVAGFDIIYACQDAAFDRRLGLRSLPARLGKPRALAISALCHALCLGLFWALAAVSPLGAAYLFTLTLAAGLLAYEQSLVSPRDLTQLNKAFFTLNGYVSLLMFVGGWIDLH